MDLVKIHLLAIAILLSRHDARADDDDFWGWAPVGLGGDSDSGELANTWGGFLNPSAYNLYGNSHQPGYNIFQHHPSHHKAPTAQLRNPYSYQQAPSGADQSSFQVPHGLQAEGSLKLPKKNPYAHLQPIRQHGSYTDRNPFSFLAMGGTSDSGENFVGYDLKNLLLNHNAREIQHGGDSSQELDEAAAKVPRKNKGGRMVTRKLHPLSEGNLHTDSSSEESQEKGTGVVPGGDSSGAVVGPGGTSSKEDSSENGNNGGGTTHRPYPSPPTSWPSTGDQSTTATPGSKTTTTTSHITLKTTPSHTPRPATAPTSATTTTKSPSTTSVRRTRTTTPSTATPTPPPTTSTTPTTTSTTTATLTPPPTPSSTTTTKSTTTTAATRTTRAPSPTPRPSTSTSTTTTTRRPTTTAASTTPRPTPTATTSTTPRPTTTRTTSTTQRPTTTRTTSTTPRPTTTRTTSTTPRPTTTTTTSTTPRPTTTTTTSTTSRPTTTTTFKTTSTEGVTTTEKPTIPDICEGGEMVSGVIYKSHWADCTKFIQCSFTPEGAVNVFIKSCRHGTYWDKTKLACSNARNVDCPFDLCKLPGYERVPSTTNCRGYWTCEDGRSVGHCCPPQHSYDVTVGCVPNPQCNDPCGEGNIIDVCDKRAVNGQPLMFEQSVAGQGWVRKSCSLGTAYSVKTCTCMFRAEINKTEIHCEPELYLPFNGDIKDESGNNNYLQVDGVKVVDGTGYFDGKSLIRVPRFSNMDFGGTLIIKLRYKEEGGGSAGGQPQALVANGDCNQPSSLYMVTGQGRVEMGLRTRQGHDVSVTIPSNVAGWKEAVFVADNSVLQGAVTGVSYQTIFTGSIETSKCAMQIGRGTEFKHFTGYMDEVTVYLCRPKGF